MGNRILFRGKRMDNGEWVEGSFLRDGEAHRLARWEELPFSDCYIVPKTERDNVRTYLTQGILLNTIAYHVIPATVGQYTGMNDKNGNQIFVGDIVCYTERQIGGRDVPVAYPVEFEEGGFCVRYYFLNNWLRQGPAGNIQLDDIEVIGNIHDNPELMEDSNDGK